MRSLRLLLALLLALALLPGMAPATGASDQSDGPDYACADAIFDQIYGRLHGRKAVPDETSRADSVERLLAAADGVVPGSVRRTGNDLTWMAEGGVACRLRP